MAPPGPNLPTKGAPIPPHLAAQAFKRERKPLLRNRNKEEAASLAAIAARKKGAVSSAPARKARCSNKDCKDSVIVDGTCQSCGRVIDESNIVAEVQFLEAANGAAQAQGQFVAADQAGVSSRNPALRRLGGSFSDNRNARISESRNEFRGMVQRLGLPDSFIEKAVRLFTLAVDMRFNHGRRLPIVYGVILYALCRQESEKKHQITLLELADMQHVNVFHLGRTYKAFYELMPFGADKPMLPMPPEMLIYRFAARLEFDEETDNVALDAVRIVKQMSHDWISQGRNPSGICGAALIMAARLHNFRRTVREVVYIVKVTMQTINMRMDEFVHLGAAKMTIQDWLGREFEGQESAHKPPVVYRREAEREKRLKRKRVINDNSANEVQTEENGQGGVLEDLQEEDSEASSFDPKLAEKLKSAPPVIYPREDPKDGRGIGRVIQRPDMAELIFAENGEIELENLIAQFQTERERYAEDEEHADEQDDAQPKKRGRPKGPKGPPKYLDKAWEKDEEDIEAEIEQLINDPTSKKHAEAYKAAQERARLHILAADEANPSRNISMDADVLEDEFADDPEVAACVLTEEEVTIKETIWSNENKDWLRNQQAKVFKQRMAAAGPPKQKRTRRKKPRIGDPNNDGPFESAFDSAMAAAEKFGFSSRINYDVLTNLGLPKGPRSATSASAAQSTVQSERMSREGTMAADGAASGGGARDPVEIPDDDEGSEGDYDGYDEDEQMPREGGEFDGGYDDEYGGGGYGDDDGYDNDEVA